MQILLMATQKDISKVIIMSLIAIFLIYDSVCLTITVSINVIHTIIIIILASIHTTHTDKYTHTHTNLPTVVPPELLALS